MSTSSGSTKWLPTFTIVAASCILPLSGNPLTAMSLGTRHRAALGLSEETDAAVIVVSEQTGDISVAHRGVLYSRLDEGRLRSELSRIFRIRPQDEPPAPETAAEDAAAAAPKVVG